MSYYRGDYYRGDPGIGSFLLGAAKSAASFIPGVGGFVSSLIPSGVKAVAAPAAAGISAAAGSAIKAGTAIVAKHPVLSAAGAAGVGGLVMGAGGEKLMGARMAMNGGAACPRGFHISKSKHAKHFGQCVRNRRMNSTNPRALRRAVRRLHSFARHYRKTVGFVSPHPKKGRMYFKKKKRA